MIRAGTLLNAAIRHRPMSFLQPILLFALAAAGIPLLLHLLSLRKLKVIPYSTLTFLKELQRSRLRALRMKQLLLLLLRTLLVICIVLAFARPVVQGALPGAVASAASTNVALLVDDSYSMLSSDGDGPFFRRAIDASMTVLAGLSPEDRVLLVPLSRARVPLNDASDDWFVPERARNDLTSLKPSAITVPLTTTLANILPTVRGRTGATELYIISDFQAGLLRATPELAGLAPLAVRSFLLRINEKVPANAAPTKVRLSSSIVERGRPLIFEASPRNVDTERMLGVSASLYLGAQRTDQRVLQLEATRDEQIALHMTPRETGLISGSIALEGDEADFDNIWSFALRVPETRSILLIASDDEASHLQLALSSARSDQGTGIRITRASAERVTTSMVREHDAVIVSRVPSRPDVRESIVSGIRSGKGLILIPPAEPSASASFTAFARTFGVTFGALRDVGTSQRPLALGQTDLRHPLFSGMFTETIGGAGNRTTATLESPDILRVFALRSDEQSSTIISMSDRAPFLISRPLGAGRVLAYAAAMDPSWSTLPVTGLFAPLMYRSVAFVSDVDALRGSIIAGSEVAIPLAAHTARSLRLTLPDKTVLPVQASVGPDGAFLRFSNTFLPGIYSLSAEGLEVDRFAVNLDPAESDTRVPDRDELVRACSPLDPSLMTILDAGELLPEQLTEARVGSEFRSLFLVLALCAAMAELLIAAVRSGDRVEEGRS